MCLKKYGARHSVILCLLFYGLTSELILRLSVCFVDIWLKAKGRMKGELEKKQPNLFYSLQN